MSVFGDLLGGKKPVRRGPTAAEGELGRAADSLEVSRGSLDNASNLYLKSLQRGRTAERSDLLGARSADIAKAFGVPTINPNQALNNLITRGKGLSRVLQATSSEFDSQLMRDRIAAVMGGRQRQARGMGALSQAAGIQEGVTRAHEARRASDSAGRMNTLGSIAGMGAGLFANRRTLFPGRFDADPIAQGVDVGTQVDTGVRYG